MINILINDQEALDLQPGTSITGELKSPLDTNSSRSYIPGSFSYPFTVPATARNRRLLNYADLPAAIQQDWLNGPAATIRFEGNVILTGTILINSASTNDSIEIAVTAGIYNDVKDTPLNELDLGSFTMDGTLAGMIAHANDTVNNPLNHKHVFFPVNNPNMYDTKNIPVTPYRHVQNAYDPDTNSFTCNTPANTPFPYLYNIVDAIYAAIGVKCNNIFRNDDELRTLVHYSNNSVNQSATTFIKEVKLNDHVPAGKSVDFLKRLINLFSVYAFHDFKNNEVDLIASRDIMKSAPKHDWTHKVGRRVEITRNDKLPSIYEHDDDDSEYVWPPTTEQINAKRPVQDVSFTNDIEMVAAGPTFPPPTVKYVTNMDTYFVDDLTIYFSYAPKYRRWAKINTTAPSNDTFTNELLPLMAHSPLVSNVLSPSDSQYFLPSVRTICSIDHLNQSAKIPSRITFYRGKRGLTINKTLPAGHSYQQEFTGFPPLYKYDLTWHTQWGLYEQWHKQYAEQVLSSAYEQERDILLSSGEISNFKLYQKVIIQGLEYFVLSIRFTLRDTGIASSRIRLLPIRQPNQ